MGAVVSTPRPAAVQTMPGLPRRGVRRCHAPPDALPRAQAYRAARRSRSAAGAHDNPHPTHGTLVQLLGFRRESALAPGRRRSATVWASAGHESSAANGTTSHITDRNRALPLPATLMVRSARTTRA